MEIQTVKQIAPGQLDPGFNGNGQIRPNLQGGSVRATVLSAEGALTYAAWQGNGFTLYRTDPHGIPDPGFGGGSGNTGEWQFVNGEDARPTRLLLQKDGKVLVIGNSIEGTGLKPAALTRFNVNGSPDLVFGSFVIPIPHRDWAFVDWIDACLQDDGKILVAFGYFATTFAGSVLVRLHSDGKLDTSFNKVGFVEVESQGSTILLRSVVIQDGKIIVGGATTSGQLVLVRYDMEGKIDTKFGDNGFAFFATAGVSLSFGQLIVQTDGKLVIAGMKSEGGSSTKGMVMRFTVEGQPDGQWNGGLPVLTYADSPLLRWTSLAQQLDGKLVVVGYTDSTLNDPIPRDMIACRLLPEGVHDISFGNPGWVHVGTSGGLSWDVKVQSSTRIIVGGDAFIGNGSRGPVVYGLQA